MNGIGGPHEAQGADIPSGTRRTDRARARLREAIGVRRLSRRQARGTAELSVVVVALSLIAGVFLGDGLSRTAVRIADGVTWLTDSPTGEVIQVNPATGRPEVRVSVTEPGHDIDLAQHEGRLYVIDDTAGTLQAIDVASLVASSQRRVSAGGAADTLAHDGDVFLLDRKRGTLAAIDPLTGDEIGAVWVEEEGLADATIDSDGLLWSLDTSGRLSSLRWSATSAAFVVEETRTIEHSGPGSVLVGHEQGVTVFGPDEGIVHQVGTGHDVVAASPKLQGDLVYPEWSPADFVAVSSPDTSTVVIVGSDDVREVDVSDVGCADPARPEVFREEVYVPCAGEAKVIRLDAEGRQAGPDIATPGESDPELVLDDDTLIINVPGDRNALVVEDDGTVETIVRTDDRTPAVTPEVSDDPGRPQDLRDEPSQSPSQDSREDRAETRQVDDPVPTRNPVPTRTPTSTPTSKPTNLPTSLPTNLPTRNPTRTPTSTPTSNPTNLPTSLPTSLPTASPTSSPSTGPTSGPSSAPPSLEPTPTESSLPTLVPTTSPPTTTTTTPPVVQPTASRPTDVRATARTGGQVQVDWAYAGDTPDSFRITRVGGGELARVDNGAARQVVVTVSPGEQVSFTVTAVVGGSTATSAASNTVTPQGVPGAPTNVRGVDSYGGGTKIERYVVDVTWGAAPDNGSAITGYRVVVTSGSGTSQTFDVGPDARSQQFREVCVQGSGQDPCTVGGSFTATVTATNALGTGPGVTVDGSEPAPPPNLPETVNTDHVTATDTQWQGVAYEGSAQTTVTIRPPADWASFRGTCSYVASDGGQHSGTIACDATSVSYGVNHGIVRSQNGGQVTHYGSIRFVASNGNGTVQSATHQYEYQGGSLCSTCPIP